MARINWLPGETGGTLVTADRLNSMVDRELTDTTSPARISLNAILDSNQFRKWAAAPNGNDDTATIRDAMLNDKILQPGVYKYNGNGEDYFIPRLHGSGATRTAIEIPAGVHFIDSNQMWGGLEISNIQFIGGAGAIRNRYTGTNNTNFFRVTDCKFYAYTGAAISHNSSDMPFWIVEDNIFWGVNSSTSVGVALAGLTDGCAIRNNKFLLNKVHVKLGRGGNNAYLENNDFAQFETGTSRASVWVVPSATAADAGDGFVLDHSKFAKENMTTTDYRVLYADEGAGNWFGERFPNLTSNSVGYISGHTIRDVMVASNGTQPLIYSTTPNIAMCNYTSIKIQGAAPTHLFVFRTAPTVPGSGRSQLSIIGPVQHSGTSKLPITNAVGFFMTLDPALALTN